MNSTTLRDTALYAPRESPPIASDNRDRILAELRDRQLISDVMLRFGRGLDLHDWDMYAATLDDEFDVDFFDLTGQSPTRTDPKTWAAFASACLERLVVHHQYSNFAISIDEDTADGTFYYIARHRWTNRFGADDYTQYGWYENSFRRTPEGWKISKLKHGFQWCDGNPTLIDQSDPEWQRAAAAVFGR
ncbi:MAG: nuclear transport factor 2 family protein [Microbacterium sp.]